MEVVSEVDLRAVDGEGLGWVCAGLETYHVITLVKGITYTKFLLDIDP